MFLFFYVKTLVKRRFDVDQYGHGSCGPPVISGAAFSMRHGNFTEPADVFAHPFRGRGTRPGAEQDNGHAPAGFFDAAMLPLPELEYTGIMAKLKTPNTRVRVRRD